jgi:hypothetical protein
MRNNIVSLGSRAITGEVGKVYAAGDVNITDADIQKLNGAGDINVLNSYISDTKLAGDIITNNSEFGTLRLVGDLICNGTCKVDTLIVIGKLQAEDLECRVLRNFSRKYVNIYKDKDNGTTFQFKKNWFVNINGIKKDTNVNLDFGTGNKYKYKQNDSNKKINSTFKGVVKAETFENLCDFNLDLKYHFKNILSIEPLHFIGNLECEELYSFNILDGESINAETIYIRPNEASRVQQVMGSNIIISKNAPMNQRFDRIPKSADLGTYQMAAAAPVSIMKIESIEGDNIELDYVHAGTVSGDTVDIGDCCIIDCVEYKTFINISPNATVHKVIKL